MVEDGIYNPGQFVARLHERDDCVHYPKCLEKAAHGTGPRRRSTGGDRCLPCRGCGQYERVEPELASAWDQRVGHDPWGRW